VAATMWIGVPILMQSDSDRTSRAARSQRERQTLRENVRVEMILPDFAMEQKGCLQNRFFR